MLASHTLAPTQAVVRAGRIAAVVGFAALTGLASRIVYDPPGAAVPFTMQTAAVIAAGLALGPRRGAASQLAYLAAIAAGLPLDARLLGPMALLGPTAGYLLGFVAAAYVAGLLARSLGNGSLGRAVGALAAVTVIYACGWAWLAIRLGDAQAAFALGVVPFVLSDTLKAAVVVLASSLRLPFGRRGGSPNVDSAGLGA